jgi:dinuclear metal center YbgI/SA1388 family protein
MKIRELIDFMESHAPLKYQEKYDNSGLIVGNADMEISGVMICLDSTEEVIDDAISRGCNLVIAHHPIIFTGIKKLTGKTYIGRTVIRAIKNDVAIYAMHTNLDNLLEGGVSERIAKRIGLKNLEILDPKMTFLTEGINVGTGIIGYTPSAFDEMDFLKEVKKQMNTKVIRYTRLLDKPVNKVAVCGGACSFLLRTAIMQGADMFITADFKYHEFFDAEDKLVIADIGHYESEQFTIELIHDLITKNFSTFAAHFTKVVTNPINYL